MPFCQEIAKQYGVDAHRPIVCQVSRFDPWKDPVGVIEAFRIVREQVPDAQLVLAGSMATDDPEGFHVLGARPRPRAPATATSTCSRTSTRSARADQRVPAHRRRRDAEVAARGLRPHRERRRSGRAGRSSAGAPAASRCRSATAYDGYLVDSVEECAQRTIDLLADPVGADAMGAQGREHVRENFLSTRELEDWLRLFGELLATRVIVVSHRGPYRFAARRRRHRSRPTAAPAASSSALAAAARATATRRRAAWIAAAIDDDDRAAVAAGARRRRPGIDAPPARPRSRRRTACTTTSSRTRCCGSCTTACSTSPAGPRFDRRFRDAWDAYVAVNRGVRRRGRRATPPTATSCSCRTTSSRSCPGMLRAAPARPARRRTSRTRRSAARTRSACCPTDVADGALRVAGRGARRVPHRRAGRARTRRRRARCSARDAAIAPTFAAPLGPDPDALDDGRGVAPRPRRGRGELDELVGDRQADRCAATASSRRRTSCAASSRTTELLDDPPRVARAGRVRRDAQPVAREPAPSTSRTSSEVEQAADAGQRPLGAPTTGSRSSSTPATTSRRPSPASPATTCCS